MKRQMIKAGEVQLREWRVAEAKMLEVAYTNNFSLQ